MLPYSYNQDSFIDRIMMRRWSFLGMFFLAFLATYLFFVAIDFVPEPPKPAALTTASTTLDELEDEEISSVSPLVTFEEIGIEIEAQLPQSIYFKSLDKEVKVLNPVSRTVADLDEALLSGAVRHPDSARMGQDGNVFILGHSSHLPQVYNRNFQAFNEIEDLGWGDIIEVNTKNRVHVYRVDKVYEAVADDATVIPIAGDKRRLTLATCNSFGQITDRFIVEAVEISVRPI